MYCVFSLAFIQDSCGSYVALAEAERFLILLLAWVWHSNVWKEFIIIIIEVSQSHKNTQGIVSFE